MKQTSTSIHHPAASLLKDTSIEPYKGPWGRDQITHLLRRTTYGSTINDIKIAETLNMDGLINQLLEERELPDPPINYYFEGDPFVAVGESWIDQPYERENNMLVNSRRRSLAGWTIGNLLNGRNHIREKMTLFWSNHFVTQASVLNDPNFIYFNNNLLRANALGNFRTLVKAVTINPAMLRYLNGNQNAVGSPNENYARELFELFTIGKGDLAGPGDYSTFTEQDVTEASKILTGWRDTGYFHNDMQPAGARFIPGRHDRSTKQLSHRFNNAVITNQGEAEYELLVDTILEQEEVSKYIVRKLYRWFVYYKIDETIESNIIAPLASLFRNSNYEVKPVLQTLLSSQHFYEISSVGPMIKNPIDFVINLLIQFELPFPNGILERYNAWARLSAVFEQFGMSYYEPPNVAGWKAYYQEPLYYRTWITAATLPQRQELTQVIVGGQVELGDVSFTMDILNLISKFENPQDPNSLISELVSIILPQPLTENQLSFLKEALIPGLPDFEWTVEYNLYLNDPANEEMRRSVEVKLRSMLNTLLTLPEYYLS